MTAPDPESNIDLSLFPKGLNYPPPIASLIGFSLIHLEPGKAVMEMEAGRQHTNPMGTLHGGVLCDIADAAMGSAFASTLAEGESFTTLELKINFLKPVWNSKLRATASAIKRGRSVGLMVCEIRDETGQIVAYATSTCMILQGDKDQRR